MKKKPHESDVVGLCPRCLEIRFLTRHHIEPQRHNKNSPIVFLCWDCHREIEELLPEHYRLSFREYLHIAGKFIRGEQILVAERRF